MTFTITTPIAQDPTIQAAFGRILNLGVPATQLQIQTAMDAWLQGQVLDDARRQNELGFTPPVITPT